jgi:hypothetical protein
MLCCRFVVAALLEVAQLCELHDSHSGKLRGFDFASGLLPGWIKESETTEVSPPRFATYTQCARIMTLLP